MSYYALETSIVDWAKDKGILDLGTPRGQALKTVEEANELLEAVRNGDKENIIDALGDVLITIIIQAEMQGLELGQCGWSAYDVIAQRTGKMFDGMFVKDE